MTTQCAYRDESDLSDESRKLVLKLTRFLNDISLSETIRTLRLIHRETNTAIILSTSRTEAMSRGDAFANYHTNISPSGTLELLSTTDCTTAPSRASVSTPCFGHRLSWKFCCPTFGNDISTKPPVLHPILSIPGFRLMLISKSDLDIWTLIG